MAAPDPNSWKPETIAAYIGAAAWLVPIAAALWKWWVRPALRIIPDQVPEVGFTSFGPLFNVITAFIVTERDMIIDDLRMTLKHEGGATRQFRWAGTKENFSTITNDAGGQQTVSRDQSPIAMQVSTQRHLERLVRFHDRQYQREEMVARKALVAHIEFLKTKVAQDKLAAEVIGSKEFAAVVSTRAKFFDWKAGRYTVTFQPRSPDRFKLVKASFEFVLTDDDSANLKKNIPLIEQDLKFAVEGVAANAPQKQVVWEWVNPHFAKAGAADD